MTVKLHVKGEEGSRALQDINHSISVQIDSHEKSDRITEILVGSLNKSVQSTRR
jgi:hypothetical protein